MGGEVESMEHKMQYLQKHEKEKKEMGILFHILPKFQEKKQKSIIQIKSNIQIKPYHLNILYYDERLQDKGENSDNSAFFRMNTIGTFYGCHNLDLLRKVCDKISKSGNMFILISSGSAAEKIYPMCINNNYIRECFIYCSYKEKYLPLLNKYNKLKGVYNVFSELKQKLYSIPEIKNNTITSSNLIYFEDYVRIYIKLHFEIIRKYKLYKILKSTNFDENTFLYKIKTHFPHFYNTARQLFPDKEEIINYFKNNTNESKSTIEEVFNCKDDIKNYIKNYTAESFYYKYLNRFLRTGDFDAFRKLSSHISKFVYLLYEYREENIKSHETKDLYRKMTLSLEDFKPYESSIGRVICFPSFTSTSIKDGAFTPGGSGHVVKLIIKQNGTKSVVSIGKDSIYKSEEEYLFLPFSFFKIVSTKRGEGTCKDPHIVNLIALNSDKPIEEMFSDFMDNKTDNLDPEGLDLLKLSHNNEKIEFNPIY